MQETLQKAGSKLVNWKPGFICFSILPHQLPIKVKHNFIKQSICMILFFLLKSAFMFSQCCSSAKITSICHYILIKGEKRQKKNQQNFCIFPPIYEKFLKSKFLNSVNLFFFTEMLNSKRILEKARIVAVGQVEFWMWCPQGRRKRWIVARHCVNLDIWLVDCYWCSIWQAIKKL